MLLVLRERVAEVQQYSSQNKVTFICFLWGEAHWLSQNIKELFSFCKVFTVTASAQEKQYTSPKHPISSLADKNYDLLI